MNKFKYKDSCTQEDIVNFCNQHDIYIGLLNDIQNQIVSLNRRINVNHIEIEIYKDPEDATECIVLTIFVKILPTTTITNILKYMDIIDDWYFDNIPEPIHHLVHVTYRSL